MKVPVLINTPRNATFREYPAKDCRFLFYFLKPGKLQLCACRLSFGVEQQVETTPDKPLAVERHVLRLHARVFHELLVARVAHLLRGPLDPGEDDYLTFLGFHRALEVGDLPSGTR